MVSTARAAFYILLFSIALFSISSASILVLLSRAPSYACAFWRLFFSTMFLTVYALLSNSRLPSVDYRIFPLTLVSGIALGVHFLLWMESLFHIPVSISTTIVVSYPLFNLFIDKLVYGERITYIQILGFITGFSGILLFLHPSISRKYDPLGIWLALGGALAAAIYFSIGRYIMQKYGLLTYTLPTYGFAAITTLVYSIMIGGNIIGYDIEAYTYFILLALIPMIGGHTTMNYLLKYFKTSVVTSIALGEPVGASILAYLILGQEIGLAEAVLIAIVLSSVFTIVYSGVREKTQYSAISSQKGRAQRSSSPM